jgi:hypothetical protein
VRNNQCYQIILFPRSAVKKEKGFMKTAAVYPKKLGFGID